ncbi:MAG: XylR N-terminal domain-containing protein, partial [Rhodocyclaceae bacterium]|nr:XylR N-terminal domain-containing protein [Rhodocyclaceae bacterium]
MRPLFERAQALVQAYFRERRFAPEEGCIWIGDQRYVLVRAESLSVSFFEYVRGAYPALDEDDVFSVAGTILYDLAHGMGKADAQVFARKMGIDDPIARLSCGPVHFAYAGWAFVDISPDSAPSMDEHYYL